MSLKFPVGLYYYNALNYESITSTQFWNPLAMPGEPKYQDIQAGVKKSGVFAIVDNSTQYSIDQIPANTVNSMIQFDDEPNIGWRIISSTALQSKYTTPSIVDDETILNATFPPSEQYSDYYCFVNSTNTYWQCKIVGTDFLWDNTGERTIDAISREEVNNLLESNSIFDRNRENHTGTQLASTISDFTESAQDAIGDALLGTDTIDLTYNDATNKISGDVKDLSLTNSKIATNADIAPSKIKQSVIIPVLATPTNNDTQDVINNKSLGLINNLQSQIDTRPIGASNGNVYYLTSQISAIPNYELISFSPDTLPLTTESVIINSTTAKASRLIHSYIANYEIGSAIINGGNWLFNFYGYVSHLNSSRFEIDILKRDIGGTETLLFTCETTNLLQTSQISPDLNIVNVETTQQDFACNTTDKIVIKVYGKTDRTQDTTITLLHSGTEYASHIHTPLIFSHNNLAGTQGGTATEKYHLSLTDYNKVLGLDASLLLKENVANKVSAFTATPNNTNYTTEKLVKDNLDLKENVANKVSAFTATPNNTNYITELLAKTNFDLKVDKVLGKQLSTEDYTTAEKNKLAGIQDGAEVNVQANWSETNNTLDSFIQNKPTLGTVASKNVGTAISNIQENGAVLVSLQTVETDASGKFITVVKNDAYNQTFGTGTNNVARGDASYLKADTYNKTQIDAELNNKLDTSLKGANGGLAELDSTGKVPSSQLPAYVDDVIEVANFASLPAIGETGKIYISIDTNLQYRWSGTQYVEISASLALGETSSTAYRGDRGKIAYDHSQITLGNPHGTTKTDVGLGNVDNTADIDKNVLSATKFTTARNINGVSFDGTANITIADNTKEPAFAKNTAFNKNFGINANTVTEGNDARLGTKNIDETNIANNRIQVYNSISGKLEYQDKPLGSTNLSIANKTGTTLDITSDTGTDATIPGATTTEAGLLSAIDKIKLNNTSGTNSGDQDLSGLMVKSQNLSDVANRQTSLNNLTNTASATNEYVLTKDTATGNAIFKPAVISSNKPPLTYFVNASDIQISGTGTSATITWNAQSNAVRYKLFVKQTSLGAINIITDTPVTTVNAPTNLATVTVSQGVTYTYAILADNSVNAATDIINFATATLISSFTLDTFDLSAGTTATLSWDSIASATEYRIQYQRATSLTAPTIIAGITGTSSVITGLTPSNPDDATTPYSFKLLAYNGSGQVIAETPVNTRPVFARINLRYFYDSTVNITVSTITRSSDLATCNTTANHNLKQGDVFTITNSVAPFNVSYGLVFDVPSLTSFRYVVANSGSTSSTGTLQKFENPFITWNYYKFSQYLTGFETTIKKILPRNPVAYTLSTTPVDYTAELIFPTAKYQNSGDSIAGWYLIKYHNSDDAITILADATNKNVAMQMFDGTFSYSDRQDKFLFAADDHRCYKLWHGGFAYLQTAGNDISNGANFYRLNTNLTENTSGVAIANRPSELSSTTQAMPVRLSLSSYTIYFDNDNQRLIYQKKDGTRKTILTYSSLGLSNIYGFTVIVGGGTSGVAVNWYTVTNNLDTIIIANRGNTSIGSYRLIFNFTAGTVVVSTVNRISDTNLQTEENCFGDQIDTYFNLRTNAVQAVRYFSGSAPTLTLRLYSTPLTDLSVNTTDLTMTVPGSITQPGIGPVSVILVDGSIYWIDWGHDDKGMYRLSGDDDGLGIVKMVNMSVHPRLLPII